MPFSPTPTTAPSTLRPDLAEFFEFDLEMERQGFVGHKVLPVVEVGLQADNPGKMPLEQILFDGETARASGSGYNRGNFTFETYQYATKENGWEEAVDQRDKTRYGNIVRAELFARDRAWGLVSRRQEQRIAASVFNPSTWTGSALTTGITNEWDDNHTANAVPIDDVEGAVRKVYEGTGMWPNALIINRIVFRNLRNLDQIIERIASTGAGDPTKASDITTDMLAAVFDLEHVIVAGNSKNTANKGQSASISQIWDSEYAMVCRIAETGDMREPCLGRTFHWAEDGSSIGGTIEEYWEEQTRSNVIRVRHETDEVVMYPQMGHLLSNVTT